MSRSLAIAANRSPSGLGALLVLTVTLLGLTFPAAAPAFDVKYRTPTSAPEGRAVCSIKGSIRKALGPELEVTLSPSMGEASLDFELDFKTPSGPAGVADEVAAGTQPGCDIFPDAPSSVMVPFAIPAKFFATLDIHAHPGSDCLSASTGEGTVTIATGLSRGARLARPKCDDDPSHANLQLRARVAPTALTGEVLTESVRIENHGPGEAINPTLSARLPKEYSIKDFSTSRGTCHFVFQKNTLLCDLGLMPSLDVADVTLAVIPLAEGERKIRYDVIAENDGKLLPTKDKVETEVSQGTSAILSLTLKCKGAAGTVTINPDANGGVTTCTCPDPNDATHDVVQCIEIYSQKTTVTLTPAATTGRFNKWTGACAGNPAACVFTLDPSAQNPDQSATAKFK